MGIPYCHNDEIFILDQAGFRRLIIQQTFAVINHIPHIPKLKWHKHDINAYTLYIIQ